jgi:hypothetical protein
MRTLHIDEKHVFAIRANWKSQSEMVSRHHITKFELCVAVRYQWRLTIFIFLRSTCLQSGLIESPQSEMVSRHHITKLELCVAVCYQWRQSTILIFLRSACLQSGPTKSPKSEMVSRHHITKYTCGKHIIQQQFKIIRSTFAIISLVV